MISPGPSVLRLATFVNGYPFKPNELEDGGLPVVRIRQLVDPEAPFEFAKPPANAVYVKDDDLIFSWSATLAVRRWSRGPGLLNQHLFRVDPNPRVDKGWLQYVLEAGIERLKPLMHGSAMTHITREMLRTLTIALPTAGQQRVIADFLDAETARIDALIAKKRHLSELLEDRILEVERELTMDLSAPLVPLRWFVRLGSGEGIPTDEVTSAGETPVVGGNGVMGWTRRPSFIDGPSIAVGRVGALCGNVHAVDAPAWITDNALWIRSIRAFDRDFLAAALRASRLNDLADKTAQPLLTGEKVKRLRIRLPADAVQQSVVVAIQRSAERSDTLRRVLTAQIGLLQERRLALITAAVTGELEIPGVAA